LKLRRRRLDEPDAFSKAEYQLLAMSPDVLRDEDHPKGEHVFGGVKDTGVPLCKACYAHPKGCPEDARCVSVQIRLEALSRAAVSLLARLYMELRLLCARGGNGVRPKGCPEDVCRIPLLRI
jgi:hypothetical protein